MIDLKTHTAESYSVGATNELVRDSAHASRYSETETIYGLISIPTLRIDYIATTHPVGMLGTLPDDKLMNQMRGGLREELRATVIIDGRFVVVTYIHDYGEDYPDFDKRTACCIVAEGAPDQHNDTYPCQTFERLTGIDPTVLIHELARERAQAFRGNKG